MREIKSRAWDGQSMQYVGFSIHAGGGMIPLSGLSKLEDDSPIMQWTGLTDKEGKLVFCGDLIICQSYPFYGDAANDNPTFKELNYIGEVYFWDEEMSWCVDMRVASDRVRGAACGGGLSDYKDCEVIGNKYQDANLLE